MSSASSRIAALRARFLRGGRGMSGPDRPTYGRRFDGPMQFARTDQANLRRGEPIREVTLLNGAIARIVPLEGSNRFPRSFDVCATYRDAGVDVLDTTVCRDELEALAEFDLLCRRATRAQSR